MCQINVPDGIIDELMSIMNEHPTFSKMQLYHRSDYVNEALKDFVRFRGNILQETLASEFDRFLLKIVEARG